MDLKILFLATLTGIIASTFRSIPRGLLNIVTYLFSYKISTTSGNLTSYNKINEWIFSNCHSNILERKAQCTRYRDSNDNLVVVKSVGLGQLKFFEKGCLFIVNHQRTESLDRERYTLDIDIVGKNAKAMYNNLLENSFLFKDKDTVNIKIGYGKFNIKKRNIDSIYMNKLDKKYIKKSLDNFQKEKELYQNLETPHRLGFLLYGKAGTGKTSLAKAIASYTDRDIVSITGKDLEDGRIDTLSTLGRDSVLLIEEIDTFTIKREENKKESSTVQEDRLRNLLNLIDGIATPEDLIVIATTNYIDKLDDALIREGRFDLKFEMKYLENEEVQEIIREKGLSFDNFEKLEYPIAPCKLQLEIMKVLREAYTKGD